MRRIAFRPFSPGLRLVLGLGPAVVACLAATAVETPLEWAVLAGAVALLLVVVFASGAAVFADEHRVAVALLPFWRRRIPWADVRSLDVVTVRPFEDFGGWGIKGSHRRHGVLVSTGDEQTVAISTVDGRRYLVGLGPEAADALRELQDLRPGP